MRKLILKNILLLIGSALTGLLLLALCFLLPVTGRNISESNDLIASEGWHPFAAGQDADSTLNPDELDNWTDSLMISTAGGEVENNIFFQAMNMPNSEVPEGYSYYWHGYVSILRPLLYFFNYKEIRVLNSLIQLLLIGCLMAQIGSMKGMRYAAVAATAFVFLMPMAVGESLQFSWVFYIGTGGCLILLHRQEYFSQKARVYLAFTVLGILTAFFDLLTYPLFTWGFPLIWWIALSPAEKKQLTWVKDVVFTGISWIVGYGGMWFLKWVLGTLILHKNVIQQAIDEVFMRSNSDAGRFLGYRWDAVGSNWRHYSYKVYVVILLTWVLWFGIQGLRRGWKTYSRHGAMLLICAAPVMWYMVLSQHTSVHHFFTYRIFSLTILALLILFTGSLGEKPLTTGKEKLRCLVVTLTGGIVALCLAVPLALLSGQALFVHNGRSKVREVPLTAEETLNFEFRPTFTEILEVRFCFKTNEEDGFLYINLYEEDKMIDQLEIPLTHYYDTDPFSPIDVNWKFRKNKNYSLSVSLEGASAGSFLLTKSDQPKLQEFGEVILEGETLDGQPIMGFIYRRIPERNMLIYIIGTWATVWFAALLRFFPENDLIFHS